MAPWRPPCDTLRAGSTSGGRSTGTAMSCMSDEIFFDTNIIAYAFDRSDERKRQPCQRLVRLGFQGDLSSCISNQVLGELFLVLTKKVGRPLSKKVAGTRVRGFMDSPRWKNRTTATSS